VESKKSLGFRVYGLGELENIEVRRDKNLKLKRICRKRGVEIKIFQDLPAGGKFVAKKTRSLLETRGSV